MFIAFREHLNYKILAEYAHDRGNYLIIHSLIQDMLMVLVNYYAPNAENEQVKVLIQIKNILDNLEISQDTSVILVEILICFLRNRSTQTVGIRQLKLNLCPNCRKL